MASRLNTTPYDASAAKALPTFIEQSPYDQSAAIGLQITMPMRLFGRKPYDPAKDYPDKLRRVRFYDLEHQRGLVFLTNHFGLPAITVAQLYQQRWQIELFFRWLKQHLRIKAFYGTRANAVRTQLWVAVCVYALVAIAKKHLRSKATLYEILQILSVSVFEKTPLPQLFQAICSHNESPPLSKQLVLFE